MKAINIYGMLPFLDNDDKNELADLILQSETWEYKGLTIQNLLPFLEKRKIEDTFYDLLHAGKDVSAFYPFLPKEMLHQIATAYMEGTLEIEIDALYPFLPKADIKAIFRAVMEKD